MREQDVKDWFEKLGKPQQPIHHVAVVWETERGNQKFAKIRDISLNDAGDVWIYAEKPYATVGNR